MIENEAHLRGVFIDAWTTVCGGLDGGQAGTFRPTASQVAGNYAGALALEKELLKLYSKPNPPAVGDLAASADPFVQAIAVFMRARQDDVSLAVAFERARAHIRCSPGGRDYRAGAPKPRPAEPGAASTLKATGWQTYRAPG